MFDPNQIRSLFPLLTNRDTIYLDNAATTQKFAAVIQKESDFYQFYNSNIHRGLYDLSQEASQAYENARKIVATYLKVKTHEIIFTKGTTESINLIAQSFGQKYITKGDQIILSYLEHHANIVPWQLFAEKVGAKLCIIPIDSEGNLDLEVYKKFLNERTKLVAVTHASNVLGNITPIKEIIKEAHLLNIPVLVDGAQAIPHLKINLQELDCDFYAFSSHKVYGPMGVGVLFGKEKWLNKLPPYQSGGGMVEQVTFEKTTFKGLPERFEAGTPNIPGVIGLGEAFTILSKFNLDELFNYEQDLHNYLYQKLKEYPDLTILGPATMKVPVLSFATNIAHPHDLGTFIAEKKIAIRVGSHCAHPLHQRLNLLASLRISLSFYNTKTEIDTFLEVLQETLTFFKR